MNSRGKLAVTALSVVVLMTACGGGIDQRVGNTTYPLLAVPTSTADTIEEPTDLIECSESALTTAAAERVGFFDCDTTWAVLQPATYSNECTDCESVWLYEWVNTEWQLRARCNQYVVLDETSCQALSGKLANATELSTMAAFPPKDVRCAIWDANTWEENLAETGCSADH